MNKALAVAVVGWVCVTWAQEGPSDSKLPYSIVQLKTGAKVAGTVTEEGDTVTVSIPNLGEMTYKRSQIEKITPTTATMLDVINRASAGTSAPKPSTDATPAPDSTDTAGPMATGQTAKPNDPVKIEKTKADYDKAKLDRQALIKREREEQEAEDAKARQQKAAADKEKAKKTSHNTGSCGGSGWCTGSKPATGATMGGK